MTTSGSQGKGRRLCEGSALSRRTSAASATTGASIASGPHYTWRVLADRRKGLLILLVGAPGTGKSTIARKLQRVLNAELVQTDNVRKLLFPEPRYTGGEHAAVYGWCHSLIRSILQSRRAVIFDATNLEERNRRRIYDVADQYGAQTLIVWTSAPPQIVQERMLRRRDYRDEEDQSDADWSIYLQLRTKAEPIKRPHLVLNTSVDADATVNRIVARVRALDSERARPSAQRTG